MFWPWVSAASDSAALHRPAGPRMAVRVHSDPEAQRASHFLRRCPQSVSAGAPRPLVLNKRVLRRFAGKPDDSASLGGVRGGTKPLLYIHRLENESLSSCDAGGSRETLSTTPPPMCESESESERAHDRESERARANDRERERERASERERERERERTCVRVSLCVCGRSGAAKASTSL